MYLSSIFRSQTNVDTSKGVIKQFEGRTLDQSEERGHLFHDQISIVVRKFNFFSINKDISSPQTDPCDLTVLCVLDVDDAGASNQVAVATCLLLLPDGQLDWGSGLALIG